jgi:hypothetical protein
MFSELTSSAARCSASLRRRGKVAEGLGHNQLSSLNAVVSAGCRIVGSARRTALAAVLGLALLAAGPAIAQNNAAPVAGTAVAQPAPPPAAAAPAGTPAAPAATGTDAAAPAGDAAATPPAAGDAAADAAAPAPDTRGLDQEVQGLKKDVVDLNRDLFVLEEELLFPANTQVAVFLSMDVGDFFGLDSVQLKIDQKEVINYLYTPREVEALLRGGVHRLYLGNLKVGKHELVAFFSGKGPNDRDYKRGASLTFEKGIGAKYLELKINDRQRKQQPEFEIKDWE